MKVKLDGYKSIDMEDYVPLSDIDFSGLAHKTNLIILNPKKTKAKTVHYYHPDQFRSMGGNIGFLYTSRHTGRPTSANTSPKDIYIKKSKVNESFDQLVESFLAETNSKSIGIFAGSFKPPHRGHYEVCKRAAQENDEVHIFISNTPREMIEPEMAKKIWDVFVQSFPNVIIKIASITPIKSAFTLVETLNSNPDAGNYIVRLYTNKDDKERYKRIPKFSDNLGKIEIVEVPRLLSARDVRATIAKNDWTKVASYMPKEVDINSITNIIKTSTTIQ